MSSLPVSSMMQVVNDIVSYTSLSFILYSNSTSRLVELNSTETLSLRIYDYVNLIWLPALSVFGVVANTINLVVLHRTRLPSAKFKFMLINSVCDFISSLIQFSVIVIRCGTLCPFGYARGAKIFELYVFLYVGYIIITFNAFNDLIDSLHRVWSKTHVIHDNVANTVSVIYFILFIFCMLLLVPDYIIAREVREVAIVNTTCNTPPKRIFSLELKEEFTSGSRFDVLFIFTLIRGPILFGSVFVVNMYILVTSFLHSRRLRTANISNIKTDDIDSISLSSFSSSSSDDLESNRLLIGFIYILLNSFDIFQSFIDIYFNNVYDIENNVLMIISNTLLFSAHGFSIFIYYQNSIYRHIFKQIFHLNRKKTVTQYQRHSIAWSRGSDVSILNVTYPVEVIGLRTTISEENF